MEQALSLSMSAKADVAIREKLKVLREPYRKAMALTSSTSTTTPSNIYLSDYIMRMLEQAGYAAGDLQMVRQAKIDLDPFDDSYYLTFVSWGHKKTPTPGEWRETKLCHVILVPVFNISYEDEDRMKESFNEFAVKVMGFGGIVVRDFNAMNFIVYLPNVDVQTDVKNKIASGEIELTQSMTFAASKQLDRNQFGCFCKGIIDAGGVIVPDVSTKMLMFYLPAEGQ